MPKVRLALSFHTPGIFRERELLNIWVLMILRNFQYQPKFLVSKIMHVLSKETAKRLRTTSHSSQGKQILKCRHTKNRFYCKNDAALLARKSGLCRRSLVLSAWNAPWELCPLLPLLLVSHQVKRNDQTITIPFQMSIEISRSQV